MGLWKRRSQEQYRVPWMAAQNTGGVYGPAIVLYNTTVMDPCYTYTLFFMFVLYLHTFYVFV